MSFAILKGMKVELQFTGVALAVILLHAAGLADSSPGPAPIPPNAVSLNRGETAGPRLVLRHRGDGLELVWPSVLTAKDGAPIRPSFEIERSTDLCQWESVGYRTDSPENAAAILNRLLIQPTNSSAFYRVTAGWYLPQQFVAASAPASGGAEVFGYAPAFAKELPDR